MIDTLLFDVGGVLSTWLDPAGKKSTHEHLARQLGYDSGRAMWLRFYRGDEWRAAKTGGMTRAEMWASLLSEHGVLDPAGQARFLARLFYSEGIHPAMRDLVVTLKPYFKLGILSNADDELEAYLERVDMLRYFGVVVNSHHIGVAKPHTEAYELALGWLNARPGQVLFIDNQTRNTEAAQALSIASHYFTDVPSLITDLTERNLYPLPTTH